MLAKVVTVTTHLKAWQCIGCGRIEAPQTCVGVCQDRKVEFVYAVEHAAALAEVQQQASQLTALVRKLACITPRDGEWERTYRALQEQARRLLAELDGGSPEAVARG